MSCTRVQRDRLNVHIIIKLTLPVCFFPHLEFINKRKRLVSLGIEQTFSVCLHGELFGVFVLQHTLFILITISSRIVLILCRIWVSTCIIINMLL